MPKLPETIERQVLRHSDERMFEVVRYDEIGTSIDVVCGGFAMFIRVIKLEEEEIARFEQLGESALYKLVAEVCKGEHSDREWRAP